MKKSTKLYEYEYSSPYGKIRIILQGGKVKRVIIGKFKKIEKFKNKKHPISEVLDNYFKKGEDSLLKKFPVVWEDLKEKQKEVLKYVQKNVKKGKVITYGELAKIFKTSPRAIGQFMKKNPFPIFVPCHRVVGKKDFGGYSPDLRWKKALLEIEKR